jgi:MFS transporter, AAHS family, 4-hydroxybenzoate transporter
MATVDITRRIDDGGFGRFQLRVATLCAALVLIDGFDLGAVAYVVPVLAPEWGVKPAAFGAVFVAGLAGVFFGTLFAGPMADLLGRKRVILAAVATFGSFELATAFVTALGGFAALRFATGLGIGALMPISIALTSEYAPKRIRTTVTAIMFLGFPLGVGAAGFIGAEIIPHYGWRSMFLLGGAAPLLLLPVTAVLLPESIRFLVARGERPQQVARLMNRLARAPLFTGADSFTAVEEKTRGFTVKSLFAEGRAVTTTLLWVAFFCNLLVVYFLNAWLPTVLHAAGVPLATSFRLNGANAWGGVAAIVLLGPVVDRFGATRIVPPLFALAALSSIGIGLAGSNVPLLLLACIGAGAGSVAGQSFINILAAALYPTAIRSTGVAWALGVGRGSSTLGPVLGGALLAAQLSAALILYTAAAPALVACGAILLLGRRFPAPRALEEVA